MVDEPFGLSLSKPIISIRVYQQIVQEIRDLISQHKLKPGDRLPTEREMAERFRVSRTSIRAAIHTLDALGLIESRQGDGTYVRTNELDALPDTLLMALQSKREAIEEILTARKILEPSIAAQAAQMATPQDIADLEDVIRRHEEKTALNDPGVEEDAQFHRIVARATGNTVVLEVMEVLADVIRESRELLLRYQSSHLRRGHREILTALQARDSEAARQAMVRHIGEVEAAYGAVFNRKASS